MTTATKDRLTRAVQFRAFDELPKSVQDALNYSNVGFTPQDIMFLHSLFITKKKTAEEIVDMIRQKDAFVTLLSPFGRRMV